MENKHQKFKEHWEKIAYQPPTFIQERVYPILKEKQHVVGISPTGTGKTVAYALPLLENVVPKAGIQLVILAPSQELSVQITEVVKEWAALLSLKVQPLIGGANIKRQLEKLREKPEIIVGTPGRILELSEMKKLKLHQVQSVVLDECDYMLKDQQLDVVRKLLTKMPNERQLSFFSATKSDLLDELPKWFGIEPLVVDVTNEASTIENISHAYIEGPTRKRVEVLRRLAQVDDFSALVFVNNMANLTLLAEKLNYERIPVAVLHSEKNKVEREQALSQLKSRKVKMLLTTDVASRGLDIVGLPYVVQYDLPLTKESYVHRAGRTGRMGAKGTVLTLVNDRELRTFKQIIKALDYQVTPRYLSHRQILLERPEQEEVATTASNQAPAKVKKDKPKKPAAEPSLPLLKKKKKNRTKDRKNKGKRTK
ncbi:DEAD/DEAH box helicase [Isobaculum melis]|uniref:Superfamily II DNA and RNA helicase n=1 Tax=Isobaculum melis TaxID=142588 RepID=A0A1H9TZB2_9LACT|nr:DEAD/DEAH box helicase [Isobaculum melis]SES02113.1 Superfamily II DNA and RNA helicase [Isobaculum melis]